MTFGMTDSATFFQQGSRSYTYLGSCRFSCLDVILNFSEASDGLIILSGVNFWGRKCENPAQNVAQRRAVSPSLSDVSHAIPALETYTTEYKSCQRALFCVL